MALAKIHKDHKNTFVAFGGGGKKTLGQRSDTDKLAIMALQSGNKNLLSLFEQPLPSLKKLQKAVTDEELKANADTAADASGASGNENDENQ